MCCSTFLVFLSIYMSSKIVLVHVAKQNLKLCNDVLYQSICCVKNIHDTVTENYTNTALNGDVVFAFWE